jgi:hypothetical protein
VVSKTTERRGQSKKNTGEWTGTGTFDSGKKCCWEPINTTRRQDETRFRVVPFCKIKPRKELPYYRKNDWQNRAGTSRFRIKINHSNQLQIV